VTATVLVADDDAVARDLLVEVLSREGYHVLSAADGNEAIKASQSAVIDLALIDLRMPGLDGLEILHRLTRTVPDVVVIILTAFATMDTTIATIRAGAYDYLSKPFRMEEIKLVVRRGLEARRLERENRQYRAELKERYRVDNLVGQSAPMIGVYKLIARVAALDTTVLVLGETGTGKEVVARSIHYASPRSHQPFVVVDCTSLPDTLFESELFGHTRGAFTGAVATRRGLLEAAEGGTVLIDEIGDLSAPLQAKLLRVLQERAVRRVGDNESVPIDVRIIAATNRDLKQRVRAGAFREDLYYRLNVVTITVPPLRERLDDLPLLAQHFLQKHAQAASKPVAGSARETLAALPATPGPATCASSSTPSSARWRWPLPACSSPTTYPSMSGAPRPSPTRGQSGRRPSRSSRVGTWTQSSGRPVVTRLRRPRSSASTAALSIGCWSAPPPMRISTSRKFALLGVAISVGACASGQPAPSRGELLQRVMGPTVQIRVERGPSTRRTASGVAVAVDQERARTWIVTARHALEPEGHEVVVMAGTDRSRPRQARVLARSPEADLALIEVETADIPVAMLKADARLGDEIWVIAFPRGRRATLVGSVVSQLTQDGVVGGAVAMIDAPVSYGASGGGVYDAATGKLLGIVEGYRTGRVRIQDSPDVVSTSRFPEKPPSARL
jgi:two-component system, NtrC family, response regulator AtoC